MTSTQKQIAQRQIAEIEDALIQTILSMTSDELRKEIVAAGGSPDKVVAEIDSTIKAAKIAAAKKRLAVAKAELGSKPNKTVAW